MAESALNRVARALDLVPYVTENPGVAIEELADKFQVSTQQIVKDLELIFLCGLPGYTPYELIDLTFEDGVVTIIEPQLLDKPRQFSETEAVIITLGLNLLRDASSDVEQESTINNLLHKLSEKFSSIINTDISQEIKPKFYAQIVEAIKENKLLKFRYQALSDDSISLRQVKPNRVIYKHGFYYLIATELKSDDERTFRLDQIINLEVQDAVTESNQPLTENKKVCKFIIRTQDRYLTERYQEIFKQVTRDGQSFIVEGEVSNQQWLHRWLLSISSKIEIIGPDDLRISIQDKVNNALSLYEKSTD
jgi:proteasome accessory factor C